MANKDKKLPRNGYALAAKMRRGGPMKNKSEPRGGNKNEQAELLVEANKCFDCNLPAVYVRYTQFAGDHYFCKEHAEKEKDFHKKDMWEELTNE